jgi:PTS system nitrogen regulatory IIA component
MNRLAAILPVVDVLVDVDATSKKRAFEQAGLLFENQHAIARATVADNLFARERLGSTGLGHGVAIPHGRIKGLKNPLAAVLRVRQSIAFDAPDDEPVSLLIFLLVPEAATQRHLEILSEIAEMLSDRELRERLKSETDPAEVHRIIAAWEPLKSVACPTPAWLVTAVGRPPGRSQGRPRPLGGQRLKGGAVGPHEAYRH